MSTAYPETWPPTQHLVLDVLAARARLGENVWTFPNSVRPAIRVLAGHGLVQYKRAPVEGHTLVWLTDEGRRASMSPSYVPPVPA